MTSAAPRPPSPSALSPHAPTSAARRPTRLLVLLAFLALAALGTAAPAHAQFDGAPAIYQPLLIASARAAGMGGIAAIAGDGATAVRHNPGFLVFGDDWQAVTALSRGLDEGWHRSTTIAGRFGKSKRVAMAGGYERLDLSSFTGQRSFDRAVRLGGGARFWKCVGLGATIEHAKSEYIAYDVTDLTAPNRSDRATSISLGVGVARAIPLALGDPRVGSTILTPMFGASLVHWGGQYLNFFDGKRKSMPRHVNAALGGRITRDVDASPLDYGRRTRVPLYALTLGVESSIPAFDGEDETLVYRYGMEFALGGILSGRLGYIDDESSDLHDTTFGFGLGLEGRYSFSLRFDYASLPQRSAHSFDRANVFDVALSWQPPEIARD